MLVYLQEILHMEDDKYVEKASLKGIVTGCGIGDANTAAGHVDVMKKTYELGKEL